MIPDEDLHRHAAETLAQADALLFGRLTYEMMEAAWRPTARTGVRPDWMEPWMEPFARTIDPAKKYVVSSTLDRVTKQVFVGCECTMIAAPVQCDVDGIPKGSH